MGTNLAALEALRREIAMLAGLRAGRGIRRRNSIWEWLANELGFVAAAIPLLAERLSAEAVLPTLSHLALPEYLEGFGAKQRRALLSRALDVGDAWWQRWHAPRARAEGQRGQALGVTWRHAPVRWDELCTGQVSFADLRLGPFLAAPTSYGIVAELRLVPAGGSGVEAILPPERTLLHLPGVSWPATIEASIVRLQPLAQVGIVLDLPRYRTRPLPRLIPSTIADGPLLAVGYGHAVAGMSPLEMAILIAAQMERGGLLSRPDRRRATLLVEEEVCSVWPRDLGDPEASLDIHAHARELWRRIVAWRRRPLRPGSVPRYVRLSLNRRIQHSRLEHAQAMHTP